jgi:hypothetical protein
MGRGEVENWRHKLSQDVTQFAGKKTFQPCIGTSAIKGIKNAKRALVEMIVATPSAQLI